MFIRDNNKKYNQNNFINNLNDSPVHINPWINNNNNINTSSNNQSNNQNILGGMILHGKSKSK